MHSLLVRYGCACLLSDQRIEVRSIGKEGQAIPRKPRYPWSQSLSFSVRSGGYDPCRLIYIREANLLLTLRSGQLSGLQKH
jgi:hypothetical protein